MKYGVTAVLIALYAGASAWIVAREGADYRENLRAAALQARPPGLTPPPPGPDDHPGPMIVVKVDREPEPEPKPTPKVEPTPEPPAPSVAKAPTPAPVPPPAATPDPGPPIDPFWGEPGQKKVWDLDHLTTEDERQLGQALNQMVLRYHPALGVGTLPRRLEEAAEPLLKTVVRKDVTYTFTVLNCESTNAFSHPGGYIYVCKGLFDWIAEDEDYALQFILAHEIAHVDLAHAIECLRDPKVKKLNLGTVPLFYFVTIPWGYLPPMDDEADRWALDRMLKLGKSRYETLSFLRKLEDYAKKNGFENVRKKPTDEPKIPFLDNHIRAHPIPRARLKALKAILDPPPKS